MMFRFDGSYKTNIYSKINEKTNNNEYTVVSNLNNQIITVEEKFESGDEEIKNKSNYYRNII